MARFRLFGLERGEGNNKRKVNERETGDGEGVRIEKWCMGRRIEPTLSGWRRPSDWWLAS